ncbi:Rossmann-like and DUF2520 domain-containing protein [Pseudonocardia xishanensis]|uniref:DUF2520 domain-containing protein n=1 Tax=Pseudonocardia xishanensis TaxID=630995 RepID=A0ABP8RCW4_9PSEU
MSAARPARLAVGVVSAGRVGAVLGAALSAIGHRVVATAAVSKASLHRAETLLPGVPVLPPDEVALHADLVLLAVPDDVLPGMVRGLAAAGAFRPGQILVHTAGAHGISVLEPAVEHGVLPLALHPVLTFTGRSEDVQRLTGACIAVTAREDDEVAWSVGEALVLELSAEPVRVPEQARPLYHAALAHGANHLVTLVRDCAELLQREVLVATSTGSTDESMVGSASSTSAERVIGPLLSAALDNALRHGDRALTGPVARGDVGTLRTHLRELDRVDPELADIYRVLARRTAHRAVAGGLLPDHAAAEVRATLEEHR